MCNGFNLVGKTTTSGCLQRRIRPATISPKELQKTAIWNRKALTAKCRSTGDVAQDEVLWNDTNEEVQRGWLRGPFVEAEVTEALGTTNWLCARRFPIIQGSKTRLIDDCREPQLNTALSTTEKLDLMGIDHFANLATEISKTLKFGQVHEAWKAPAFQLVGRTLDLKAAYKNLACSPGTRWCSVIVSWNPLLRVPAYFISDALMFGSSSAVYAFNRCARALWHLATRWLKLFAT